MCIGSQQNMWRFLALSDPLVDVTIFRDLDSTLNERETAAVKEWLGSNYTMHVMRDHPSHKDLILGNYIQNLKLELLKNYISMFSWNVGCQIELQLQRTVAQNNKWSRRGGHGGWQQRKGPGVAGKNCLASGPQRRWVSAIFYFAEYWWCELFSVGFVMQHDSYSCNRPEISSVGGIRHFPKCRNTMKGLNFVGSRRSIDVTPLLSTCPVVCRPQVHCMFC